MSYGPTDVFCNIMHQPRSRPCPLSQQATGTIQTHRVLAHRIDRAAARTSEGRYVSLPSFSSFSRFLLHTAPSPSPAPSHHMNGNSVFRVNGRYHGVVKHHNFVAGIWITGHFPQNRRMDPREYESNIWSSIQEAHKSHCPSNIPPLLSSCPKHVFICTPVHKNSVTLGFSRCCPATIVTCTLHAGRRHSTLPFNWHRSPPVQGD
ncbi:uncharacterized protein EDB91DRAFT_52433 [Suillus paluster]|uniref:uncharacterized protein n=1 Tax=Suillus paluster TaxID=48578 RepID=UPI001B85C619|nr:uncharacterized protein EDB91DRAFT_52433 [Suillus paluster]KAG1747973.1 hypothetical protein EDB91DRAFT_52433 [Suillus paluster]